MGVLASIGRFISDLQESSQSYNQGEHWAEAVIERHKDRYTLDFEVDADAVRDAGEEYAKDPDAFYEGFADTWNPHAEANEPKPDGLLSNLRHFLFQ